MYHSLVILGGPELFHVLHLLDVHTFQMDIGQAECLHCQLSRVDLAQNQFWGQKVSVVQVTALLCHMAEYFT